MNVLVIDDEATIREAVSDILEIANIRVLSAADGREGVELFRSCRSEIGVVILDMQMPGMNGEETFQVLRHIDPNVKIIFSSGYDESRTVQLLGKEVPVTFLQKPYNMHVLIDQVQLSLMQ